MVRPSFFVIGAARCGTTSLHHYLAAHPGVFITEDKEPTYFGHDGFRTPFYKKNWANWISTEADYLALFDDAREGQVAGEASPVYLYHPEAPARLHAFEPAARLVALLRNPIERAHSQFLLRSMRGSETLSFEEAVREEQKHLGTFWEGDRHFLRLGFYADQLSRWDTAFAPDQILVRLYDDLRADAAGLVRDVYAHIGVDPTVTPPVQTRYSMTGLPKNGWVRAVFGSKKLKQAVRTVLPRSVIGTVGRKVRAKAFERPTIDPALYAELIELYRDDIQTLSGRLDRDLSAWLRPPSS